MPPNELRGGQIVIRADGLRNDGASYLTRLLLCRCRILSAVLSQTSMNSLIFLGWTFCCRRHHGKKKHASADIYASSSFPGPVCVRVCGPLVGRITGFLKIRTFYRQRHDAAPSVSVRGGAFYLSNLCEQGTRGGKDSSVCSLANRQKNKQYSDVAYWSALGIVAWNARAYVLGHVFTHIVLSIFLGVLIFVDCISLYML